MALAVDGGQIAWLITTVLVAGVLIGLHIHLEKVARSEQEGGDDA
jgi:hypothetical protein